MNIATKERTPTQFSDPSQEISFHNEMIAVTSKLPGAAESELSLETFFFLLDLHEQNEHQTKAS